jgi:hypothetical protein
MPQFGASLTDNARGVIYYRYMFIIQAQSRYKEFKDEEDIDTISFFHIFCSSFSLLFSPGGATTFKKMTLSKTRLSTIAFDQCLRQTATEYYFNNGKQSTMLGVILLNVVAHLPVTRVMSLC